MIRHETLNPPPHIYPVNEWKVIETSFYPRFLAQTETLFSIGNGYLGMRGNFEEGKPVFQKGTFINGFHETWPIVYGEEAYGFAKTGQTMLNVTDAKTIRLFVDDEPFDLNHASLMHFERTLDMQAGVLDRKVLWETPSGKQVFIESQRLVSFEQRHLAVVSYQVTVLNATAPVVISSEVAGSQPNQVGKSDPRQARGMPEQTLTPRRHYSTGNRIVLAHQARNSGMSLACGVDHLIETECPFEIRTQSSEESGKTVFSVQAQPGKPIQVVKFIAYHTSHSASAFDLCERTEWTLDRALKTGLAELVAGQRRHLEDFWRRSDVVVEMDTSRVRRPPAEVQQALRWNLFQIHQAVARSEGAGIPAKGLTGQTYEGHYFWDTEIYLLPFLIYSAPQSARNLLKFRHSILDRARLRAKELNQKGAMFPWRTINGEEASAYYAAGTAQYHINADIIFALKKYVEVTGDKSLLFQEGAEMLVETARLWEDLGFYSDRSGGKFCIHGVTGPDEYNTVVNNNTYTNLMARENLWYAAETVTRMEQESPEHYATLVHRTGLDPAEAVAWKQAADRMYIPFDEALGIHPQDDDFLDCEVLDLKAIPPEKFPLLLYFHPLFIYRHQVIKQADVVLALFLLGHEFSSERKKRNFDYYDPLTTGDSSLSACIQAIVAAEVGEMEKAVKYARYALLMDLADIGGNVRDGVHVASMGGTWMVIIYGFAGMRDYQGRIAFDPHLPPQIRRLRFPLEIRGQALEVTMEPGSATYLLQSGPEMVIVHQGKELRLRKGEPATVPIEPLALSA